ncbi:MAG: twin-arginine translocase subunit TatC [Duncaniella sp.]|nr:twin-arginine translocase subunit TatC [Muribaculum sp.]MCM1256122.1 twin-arginine translocase subunit TatC [Duncaniella sp.]
MNFWDHAEVLRGVLLRVAAVILVMMCVFFMVMPYLFDNIILAPCQGDFVVYRIISHISQLGILGNMTDELADFHVNLINIQLASQFFIHISSSFWLSIIFSFPIIIYMLWGFISPGLYEDEKRGVRTAFLAGNIMFFLGVAVGYFLVFPLTLRFLADYQISAAITNQISLDSYMDNFMILILIMGIVFELPLLAWLLGKTGILKRDIFMKYRRHAVVALLILAAVITPTGDPFTLMVVFLPIYLLWEISAFTVPKSDVKACDSDALIEV